MDRWKEGFWFLLLFFFVWFCFANDFSTIRRFPLCGRALDVFKCLVESWPIKIRESCLSRRPLPFPLSPPIHFRVFCFRLIAPYRAGVIGLLTYTWISNQRPRAAVPVWLAPEWIAFDPASLRVDRARTWNNVPFADRVTQREQCTGNSLYPRPANEKRPKCHMTPSGMVLMPVTPYTKEISLLRQHNFLIKNDSRNRPLFRMESYVRMKLFLLMKIPPKSPIAVIP